MSKKIKPCGDCIDKDSFKFCPYLQMIREDNKEVFICGRKQKELSRLTKEPEESEVK